MTETSSIKTQPPGYTFTTEGYDIFQLIFVSVGELHFECKDPGHEHCHVLSSGDFLVLRRGSVFSLASPDTGYGGICYLSFESDDVRQTGFSYHFRGGYWLIELVGILQSALSQSHIYRHETLALIGRALSSHALNVTTTESVDAPPLQEYWAERVAQLTQNTLYGGQAVFRARIEELPLSYRQLSRHFQQHTGTSIKKNQINQRIREAKRLLQNTRFSITDIAMELHYPSSQKFATQFRNVTGLSPREYRKEVLG